MRRLRRDPTQRLWNALTLMACRAPRHARAVVRYPDSEGSKPPVRTDACRLQFVYLRYLAFVKVKTTDRSIVLNRRCERRARLHNRFEAPLVPPYPACAFRLAVQVSWRARLTMPSIFTCRLTKLAVVRNSPKRAPSFPTSLRQRP